MMARADSIALPFLVNKPIHGRIGEIFAERSQRFAHDELCRVKERTLFRRV
jgi:hypothetical protein